MTKIGKRSVSALLALILILTPVFTLSTSASALDPYAEHGLCITEIALAETLLNVTEYANGATKYNENFTGEWCAIFINWCSSQAGTQNVVPVVKMESPYKYKKYYNDLGRYFSASQYPNFVPQTGDLVFYFAPDGSLGHIGLVTGTFNQGIETVEGNVGSPPTVGIKTPCWPNTPQNTMQIAGFARPNYATDHNYNAQEIAGNENAHQLECQICDYIRQEDHFCFIETDNYNHWDECDACGFIRDVAPHIWMVGGTHHLCEYCGLNETHEYVWDKTTTKHIGHCFCGKELTENHVFPAGASRCSVCGYRPGDAIIMSKETEEIS